MDKLIIEMIKGLCEILDLDYKDFVGYNRQEYVVDKRYIVYYLMYENMKLNFNNISKHVNRDRATVRYGVIKILHLMKYEQDLKYSIDLGQKYISKRNNINYMRKNNGII